MRFARATYANVALAFRPTSCYTIPIGAITRPMRTKVVAL